MAKKHKNQNRYKVNWSNPKTQRILAHLQLGENRISRAELLSIGNKDILYSLKHSGYIEESSNGLFIGTKKLHNHIKDDNGTHFSTSGSASHSAKIRESLSLVPDSVLQRADYKSSFDIEKQFNRKVKGSADYQREIETLRQEHTEALRNLNNSYHAGSTPEEHYLAELSYRKEREEIESRLSWLDEKTYLTPDYQLTMSQDEVCQYIENLQSYADSLNEESRSYSLAMDSVEKLQSLSQTMGATITVNVEIVTNAYGNRELALHENFEQIEGTPQIFI